MNRTDRTYEEVLTPELEAWMGDMMCRCKISREEVISRCQGRYGKLSGVSQAKLVTEAADKMLNANPPPPGPSPPGLGTKPSPGGRVVIKDLGGNIRIRIWPSHHCFSFDFVDATGNPVPVPPDIRISSDLFRLNEEVLSVKQSYELIPLNERPSNLRDLPMGPDHLETYVIAEGATIRILRPHQQDEYITIPLQRPQRGHTTSMEQYM